MPSLGERQEDIPLLTEYFVQRFAAKMGKDLTGISRRTPDLFQTYKWPGNIRELQNVVERFMIVCETENFSVDGGWLARAANAENLPASLPAKMATDEKALIEAMLERTRGRVSGPSGAAAKLGMPASTLESKSRASKINKHLYKTLQPSLQHP